jgi:isocitrate/isopropylmalate dehydrogenase
MLRSVALLLRHAAAEPEVAAALERAIDHALVQTPTADTGGRATTAEFAESVLAQLETAPSRS